MLKTSKFDETIKPRIQSSQKKSQAKETCKNYTKAHHNQIFQNQK